MKIDFFTDLKDKTVVITGGGGVLMSEFGKTLAEYGANIALLDLNETAVKNAADNIINQGGNAICIKCDCLNKDSIINAKNIITEKYGKANILINGAGGNNPKGTTDIETMTKNATGKTFFDLDSEGL